MDGRDTSGQGPGSTALITGIGGQDGSYLAELLLDKGYEVHGLIRGSTTDPLSRLEGLQNRVVLHSGDLLRPALAREHPARMPAG